MHRHGDADLTAIVANSVPPLDVSRVAIFQVHLSKYNLEALFESHSMAIIRIVVCMVVSFSPIMF